MNSFTSYQWHSSAPGAHHSYLLPNILSLLPNSGKCLDILDVGCGNGFIASQLARLGHRVIGIDTSFQGIQIAKEAYPEVSAFFNASAYDDYTSIVPSVDLVVSSEVIEHLYQPKLMVERTFSVLKPGGSVILTTPYHGYYKNLCLRSLIDGIST